MKRRLSRLCFIAPWIIAALACASPPPPEPTQVDTGALQREIKVGMDQSLVTEALGPPSRVSTDSQQREVWTYEGISSDRVDPTRPVGGGITVFGGGKGGASAASPASPRTLTLIIYYDEQKKVRELAYNYSSEK